ncbi:MAG TPA: DegQ family serine endoprotease [bacterium]|nr:DegQ family serine endoprotease [bacterium]
MKKSRVFKGWTALVLGLGLSFGPVAQALALDLTQAQEAPVKLGANNAALALQNAFIDVAASVSPAVVNISSEWTEDVQGFSQFGNMNDLWRYFFNGPNGGGIPQFKQKQRSLGSGFIVTPDGTIVTNAHVVGKAEKVTVTFENGTTYPAKIIGKDTKTDIAVIKISDGKKTFPTVVLGDSDALKVGEWAIAIGNPFALDHTVTTGVISAKGRSVEISEGGGAQSYIQTDASINPGNSGGPLCNIQGEVIGINSAIYSQSGGSIGIGFAIPINIAKKVADDLVNQGKVIRAGLGAVVQSLNPQMAKSFGLSSTQGALISNINPGSAAEKAGLKPGDIVLSIDGNPVDSSNDLVTKLYAYTPGQVAHLTILRNGAQSQVSVTLQTLKDTAAQPGASADNGGEDNAAGDSGSSLGLSYQDQTPDIRQQLPEGAPKGPVVTGIEPGSPAAGSGLQPGDVILKVGNNSLVSAKQLDQILKKSDLKDGVRLFVWRNGVTLYTFLQDNP